VLGWAAPASGAALFSTALHDQTCPPSTVFAARNHYAGEADIEVYPHNQHEGGLMYQWFAQAEFLAARV
jgi:cephalosporin-C deacetylase